MEVYSYSLLFLQGPAAINFIAKMGNIYSSYFIIFGGRNLSKSTDALDRACA